ncbi:hypothetical protein PV327_002346 [Microctonus hyperodae]|uniref:RING-type domain-containing protein n=1 Tax=Microctonus hyperodae TaxID=165561 RepID=A0AA39FFH8_MICHY|nr:hypothetical protein PV327_002346 [Microctonus hyperodae]
MNVEENRLRTFAKWPENAAVNPSRMAKGGFYYTGRNTEVQCFLCEIRITDWNYGDQVMVRHRQARPDCPFVQDPSNTCNIPMVEMSNNIRTQPTSSSLSPNTLLSSSSSSSAAENVGGSSRDCRIVQSQNPRIEYGSYQQRLRSFVNWPTTAAVTPESLARAGFYYLQKEDMVECAFCRGILRAWMPNDDPNSEHMIIFPHCDFYAHQDTNNSALTVEKEDLANVKLLSGSTSDLHKLGIQKHTPPRQSKHATFEGRLRTFQAWPENIRQTPDMLAIAGFYYGGSGDQVRCFHCDGGLHNWEADDDPWTEHARWFPKCGFVSIVRGQDFIKHCIDNRPPLDPMIFRSVPEDGESHITEISQTLPLTVHSNSNGNHHAENTESETEESHSLPREPFMRNVNTPPDQMSQQMERNDVQYTRIIEDLRDVQLIEGTNGHDVTTEMPYISSEIRRQEVNSESTSESWESQGNNDVRQCPTMTINGDDNDDDNKEKPPDHIIQDKRVEDNTENGPLSLEEENRRLKEARLCKICMDREVGVVFLPCGHLVTCVHCAPSLSDCPMCRQEIRATVRTFLA